MSLFASSSRDSKQQQLSTQTSPTIGIKAFENGLWFESKLKESLMLDEPATLQDALHRSQKYVCVEESKAHHSKIHGMTKDHLACIISSRFISSRVISSRE
ncbi:unnamed protein product [Microthlaspi erraticum]|uniref:Uncharacterized protein n=1 Tax=Microthlaspi erraticum TaxID=1685480 RepID=A0A6D2KAY7_9BRAS|nr:unnamed protein product [Microthlaspi erraticum]